MVSEFELRGLHCIHTYLQVFVKDDLSSDVCGNDWVGKDSTELCCNVERVHYCHLQRKYL